MGSGVKRSAALFVAALALGSVLWFGRGPAPRRESGPLPHQAYAWQRQWGRDVGAAVRAAGSAFGRLVVLAAEVDCAGGKRRVTRVSVDHDALAAGVLSVGVALRVRHYTGSFERSGSLTAFLGDLAADLVASFREAGTEPAELQIDFDCAASKLAGYRLWVEATAGRVAPIPVTITVLPCWLRRRDFSPLIRSAGAFVLQVHSLERPRSADDSLVLCDPVRSQKWVEEAARFGIPFRVALPTYGYLIAFRADGSFLGLCAEGAVPDWPDGTVVRELRADSDAMATLVRRWTNDRPALLRGVIWYRLPVGGDRLNWSRPTLAAVMAGRSPRVSVTSQVTRSKAGCFDVFLTNDGERDLPPPFDVVLSWKGARLVAGDTYRGVEWIDRDAGDVVLRTGSDGRLVAGERRPVGWFRLSEEVKIDARLIR